jgi:hypothetical protein
MILGLGVVDMARGCSRTQPRPAGMDYVGNDQGKSFGSSESDDTIHEGQKTIRCASSCGLVLVQLEAPGRADEVVRAMDFRGC